MYCNKCGTQNPDNALFCSACGGKMNDKQTTDITTESPTTEPMFLRTAAPAQLKSKKKIKLWPIILTAILVLVIGGGGTAYYFIKKHNDGVAYIKQMQAIAEKQAADDKAAAAAAASAAEVERQYNLDICTAGEKIMEQVSLNWMMIGGARQIWQTAIDNEMDFNDALTTFYGDPGISKSISNIKTGKDNIDALMRKLQNPPDKFKNAYDKIISLYGDYTELYSECVEPQGSLNSYSSTTNASYQKLITDGNQLLVLLPSIKMPQLPSSLS